MLVPGMLFVFPVLIFNKANPHFSQEIYVGFGRAHEAFASMGIFDISL
jgi:hypothetical protein